jgi:ElaB/YqjD/DUF883 family membrane-anchored ribosome-binding protein
MRFRKLGVLLLIASIGISSANFAFTGAVIGADAYSSLNIFAAVLFLIGAIFIFASERLEDKVALAEGVVEPSEFYNHLNTYSVAGDQVFVVDTSFVASYSGRGAKEAIRHLKSKGALVVTDTVLKELEGIHSDVRDLLLKSSEPPLEGYERFKPKAREYLEQSKKAFYYEQVIPIILNEKAAPSTRREAEPYMGAVRNLVRHMSKAGKPLTRESLRKEIDSHWRVSETDVDVMAAALAEVEEGKNAFITERDVDFEGAVKHARVNNLHYANAYGEIR